MSVQRLLEDDCDCNAETMLNSQCDIAFVQHANHSAAGSRPEGRERRQHPPQPAPALARQPAFPFPPLPGRKRRPKGIASRENRAVRIVALATDDPALEPQERDCSHQYVNEPQRVLARSRLSSRLPFVWLQSGLSGSWGRICLRIFLPTMRCFARSSDAS